MKGPRTPRLTQKTARTLLPGAKFVQIPLSKLKIDPRNVRLRHLGEIANEEELQEALWKEPQVDEWYRLIREEGGITEPLAIDSDCIVREGNERLICLRRLSRETHDGVIPGFPKDQFDMVPCQKIPPTLPEREIAIWLARTHVKGKHPWKALNKALAIYELSTVHRFSYEEIRKRLGISKKTVQADISAYDATLQYHEEYPDDNSWYYKYSYYHEIFRNEQLRNWIKQDKNSNLFADWVHSGKIPRGESVRKLRELIDNPRLFTEFQNTTVTKAKEILNSFETGGSKSLKILVRATEALRDFPVSELRTIASDPIRWRIVDELYHELENFLKSAQSLSS